MTEEEPQRPGVTVATVLVATPVTANGQQCNLTTSSMHRPVQLRELSKVVAMYSRGLHVPTEITATKAEIRVQQSNTAAPAAMRAAMQASMATHIGEPEPELSAGIDDQMESSAAADSALTALRTSRTRMMLCNANGTNKHWRWFWLTDSATVHWSKSETGAAVKGKHAHSNVLLLCILLRDK